MSAPPTSHPVYDMNSVVPPHQQLPYHPHYTDHHDPALYLYDNTLQDSYLQPRHPHLSLTPAVASKAIPGNTISHSSYQTITSNQNSVNSHQTALTHHSLHSDSSLLKENSLHPETSFNRPQLDDASIINYLPAGMLASAPIAQPPLTSTQHAPYRPPGLPSKSAAVPMPAPLQPQNHQHHHTATTRLVPPIYKRRRTPAKVIAPSAGASGYPRPYTSSGISSGPVSSQLEYGTSNSLPGHLPFPISLPLPPPPPPPPPPPRSSQNALGLKNFTSTVAGKLKQYGRSSYTAVADELVEEVVTRLRGQGKPFVHAEVDKNIRRRVYDALNVFVSMRVVQRAQGKDVIWRGTAGLMEMLREGDGDMDKNHLREDDGVPSPASSNVATFATSGTPTGGRNGRLAFNALKRATRDARDGVTAKRARVAELREQHEWLRRIVTRNAGRDCGRVTTGGDIQVEDDLTFQAPDRLRAQLPFVLVSTKAKTEVQMQVEDGHENIVFNFNAPFKVHDGYAIVAKMCERDTPIASVPGAGA